MNAILAGILSGLFLAGFFLIYLLIRQQAVIEIFQTESEELAAVPKDRMSLFLAFGFSGTALLFGAAAGFVYSWLDNPATFHWIVYGASCLFSVFALITKTPLRGDKILWNIAVGGILGSFVPLLSG